MAKYDNHVLRILAVVQDLQADKAVRLLHRAEEILNQCWIEQDLAGSDAPKPTDPTEELKRNPSLTNLLEEITAVEPSIAAAVAITKAAIAERLKDWNASQVCN